MKTMASGFKVGRVVLLLASLGCLQVALAASQGSRAVEEYAVLDGGRLWYKDTGGSGIAVVLLHAATGSTVSWEHQYSALTAAGFRVIAYDRAGSGRSAVDSVTNFQKGFDSDDLQSLVNYLHLERFHLVGTAAGAFCAFDYALSHPERLRSLTIANSIGGVQDASFEELGRRLRPAPQFDALPVEFKELGPSYRASEPQGTQRWLEILHAAQPAQPLPRRALRNAVTLAALESIAIPTLLLTGDADLYAPPPIQEQFHARIKKSESVVIPGVGHSAYWEQPDQFNQALISFLARH